MKKIVHISDVHFGDTDPVVVDELHTKIVEISPDLLVVSGDLTQRARRDQFRDAKDFIDRFPMPKIVVPGNHDVPLYRVVERFSAPFRNYDEYFGDHEPWFFDGEIAAVGVNTARAFVFKGGRINKDQVERLKERLGDLDDSVLKIVVSHHPFDLPEGSDDDDIVGRADRYMSALALCGADVFLAGHLHVSSITSSAFRYKIDSERAALVIQAGTAASMRERGEENSFNLLEYERPFLTVKRYQCAIPSEGFHLAGDKKYAQSERGWSLL